MATNGEDGKFFRVLSGEKMWVRVTPLAPLGGATGEEKTVFGSTGFMQSLGRGRLRRSMESAMRSGSRKSVSVLRIPSSSPTRARWPADARSRLEPLPRALAVLLRADTGGRDSDLAGPLRAATPPVAEATRRIIGEVAASMTGAVGDRRGESGEGGPEPLTPPSLSSSPPTPPFLSAAIRSSHD